MGQWGFFDDEGDAVADFAIDIENRVLPENLKRCYDYNKKVKIPCYKINNKKANAKLMDEIAKDYGKDTFIVFNINQSRNSCSYSVETNETRKCYEDRRKFLNTHREILGDAIISIINEKEYYQQPQMIAGIAMYLARGWHGTPIFPESETVERGFRVPKLTREFPKELRKMAYNASVQQLKNFDNKMKWSSPDKRIEALKIQVDLFKH